LPFHPISGDETIKITSDAKVDALYIRFIEATVTTQHVADGMAIDYAAEIGLPV
jgi:uncharacterized protein YuzE